MPPVKKIRGRLVYVEAKLVYLHARRGVLVFENSLVRSGLIKFQLDDGRQENL